MRAIRSKNTKLEEKVSKELWRRGFRFRKNVKSLVGKPDIAIKKYRIVIFIDSCFWHYCTMHCNVPEANKDYWLSKLERNRARDREVTQYYLDNGWNILRVWEHDVNKDLERTADIIEEFIHNNLNRLKI